jgi:hypothetical protein
LFEQLVEALWHRRADQGPGGWPGWLGLWAIIQPLEQLVQTFDIAIDERLAALDFELALSQIDPQSCSLLCHPTVNRLSCLAI